VDARTDDLTSLPHANGKDADKGDLRLPRARLKFALRRARLDEAERSEVIAELRGAEIARLEMVKEEIAPLLAELPPGADAFDFGLTLGEHPRLFIDMIAFVEMGHDRRTYCFQQDTRHGRVMLAESERLDPIVEAITNYVARRVVEREKALAGDSTIEDAARAYAKEQPAAKKVEKPPSRSSRVIGTGFALISELIGSAVLIALVALGAREVWKFALAWWTGE
jgi:hypothetical protein